jgi:hypothetical protein
VKKLFDNFFRERQFTNFDMLLLSVGTMFGYGMIIKYSFKGAEFYPSSVLVIPVFILIIYISYSILSKIKTHFQNKQLYKKWRNFR